MTTTAREPVTAPAPVAGPEPEELRKLAVARLKAKRDFQGHLLAYALFNALVWVIWALTATGFPWPVFMTAGWGIGIVFNAWDVYRRKPFTEGAIAEEMRRIDPR